MFQTVLRGQERPSTARESQDALLTPESSLGYKVPPPAPLGLLLSPCVPEGQVGEGEVSDSHTFPTFPSSESKS